MCIRDRLWAEDETIGWVYQYFNSVEERRQMRAESAAPRNSRELAVRNQFFTPRYVVEFLTDNTLGRIWYEMTRGQTALVDQCRYLVRRPLEIFLNGDDYHAAGQGNDWLGRVRAGEWAAMADDPTELELVDVALMIDGYEEARRAGIANLLAWARERVAEFERSGALPASSLELWLLLFALQRQWRNITSSREAGADFLSLWRRVYHALKAALLNPPGDLSQEELLRRPVFVPHRPPKDPRDIKLLDPACGSMHFGLYAFDLFERIYDEAWEIETSRGPRALARPAGLAPLTESYADQAAFRRDVPRLILAHNLHGIDIDPRAVQIAGLSLWLRAQRSWRDQGVVAADRPAITRAHVVCAEPMPGEREMLDEFVKELPHRLVGELVVRVFDEMKLAGEAGALLKIEETLRGAIDAARTRYNTELLRRRQDAGYLPGLAPKRATTLLDLMELPDPEAFWATLEEEVLVALRDFATINGDGSYQRRLFAEDAARGFAFIDLCRQRYDVVVMNPPFGEFSISTKTPIARAFPLSKGDIYTAFIERFTAMTVNGGRVGIISNRTFLTLGVHTDFRLEVLARKARLELLADLGSNVLEAMVEVAAYVLYVGTLTDSNDAIFIPVHRNKDKSSALHKAIKDCNSNLIVRSLDVLAALPNAAYAYWLDDHLVQIFRTGIRIEAHVVNVRVGLQTSDDNRFARLRWEVPSTHIGKGKPWVHFAKGGEFSPYYDDIHLVVNWRDEGKEILDFRDDSGKLLSVPRNMTYYYSMGLTYPWRTSLGFAPRVLPSNCVFAAQGSALLPLEQSSNPSEDLLCVLGMLNCSLYQLFISIGVGAVEGAARSYQVGLVQSLPWTNISRNYRSEIASLAHRSVDSRRVLDTFDETTTSFVRCCSSATSLIESSSYIQDSCQRAIDDILSNYHELDRVVETLFGVTGTVESNYELVESTYSIKRPEHVTLANFSLSYLLGCAFGRWDIRYATGQRQPPEMPDPFAPLPVCPPGMLQNDLGLPAAPADLPDDYPLRISWPGILVDDEGHPEDIAGRVRQALAVIWPESADAIEAEACAILGVGSLRDYFARPDRFFADHLSRYSKSRRAAPIYWPLSSANGAYTVWLYYHRLTDQTLYHVVNDFVDPKLKRAAAEAARLRARGGRSRAEERELERLVDLEAELRGFREELLRVAAFWRPNLNDGVQITAAPLWRLFRHRPWQKRLRETWAKLEAGDYDWAHLAYAVWPARVREKCRSDKSLAIAHDLEHLYVAPPDAPRKKRPAPAAAAEETADDE